MAMVCEVMIRRGAAMARGEDWGEAGWQIPRLREQLPAC